MSKLLSLFKGSLLVEQQSNSYPTSITEHLVHLDTAGAYASRDAYLVFGRVRPDDPSAPDLVPFEPIVGGVTAQAGTGSPLQNDTMTFTPIEVEFGNGVFMAISSGSIWRRKSDGTWEEVYQETGGGLPFQRLAYGGGVWLAAQGGNDGTAAVMFRSSDGGDSWTPVTLGTAGRVTAVVHRDASNWLVATWHGASSKSTVWRSTDGGSTWTGENHQDWNSVFSDGTTFPDDGATPYLSFLVQNFPDGYGLADGFVFRVTDDYTTAFWQWSVPGLVGGRDNYRFTQHAHRALFMAGVGPGHGTLVTIHRDGRVNTTAIVPGSSYTGVTRAQPVQRYSGVTESGGSVTVRDAAYDPIGRALIAVGHFTPTGGSSQEARAWRSTDDGKSWTRMTEVETAMLTSIITVAVDNSGDALFLNGQRWAFSGTRRGLEGGQYNVYTVSYFNTPAGRLVFDLGRLTVTTADGGSVQITAPGKERVVNNTPWLAAISDPDEAAAIVDSLRFDVYIQQVAEPVAGVTPEMTIRYAFTESFPEGDEESVPVGRAIEELPLGRQMVARGLPTTSVLERSLTALHQGRIWGMAHQDEAVWHVKEDGISPEIANQANRFVLCYSETGWANLISDQSFIPIQPTQSQEFTGLVSTPFGLLVCFDNEIHVVTGDPAYDNVSVQLYSDIVGCDAGAPPCKLGGVVFVVWQGRVWALTEGGAQDLSDSQWLLDDPFVQVVSEPQSRSLLARTSSGMVFRYIVDKQYWFTDPVAPSVAQPMHLMLPNCVCEVGNNTRFVFDNEDADRGDVYVTRQDGDPDTPEVVWRHVDFGMPERRKALYLAKVTLEGEAVWELVYDRDDASWDVTEVPHLYVSTPENALGPLPPILRYPVAPRRVGVLSYRTRLGEAKGDYFDLRLVLAGMGRGDDLKLPFKLFFAAGGELR